MWGELGRHVGTVAAYTGVVAFFCFGVWLAQFVTAHPNRRRRPDTEWRLYSMSTLLLLSIAGFNGLTSAVVSAGGEGAAGVSAHFLYLFSIPSAPFYFDIICASFLPNVGCTYAYPRRRLEVIGSHEAAEERVSSTPRGTTLSGARQRASHGRLGRLVDGFIAWFGTYFIPTAVRSIAHVATELRRRRVHPLRAACQIAGDVLLIYSEALFLYLLFVGVFRLTGLDDVTGYFVDITRIPLFFEPADRGTSSHAQFYPRGGILLIIWGVLSGLVFIIIAAATVRSSLLERRERPRFHGAHIFFALAALLHTLGGLGQGIIGYDKPIGFPFGVYTSTLLIIALVTLLVSELNRMNADFEGTSLSEAMAAITGHNIGNLLQRLRGATVFYKEMIFKDLSKEERENHWPAPFLDALELRADGNEAAVAAIGDIAKRLYEMRRGLTYGERTRVLDTLRRVSQSISPAECEQPRLPRDVHTIELDWPNAILEQVMLCLLENAERSVRARWQDPAVGKIAVRLEYDPAAFRNPLVVSVIDNGSGLDPAIAKGLGRRPPDQRSTRGFGLFFVRQMVERIGGHVEFSSEEGDHFRATLRFPGDRVHVTYERPD
jgi:signal transduction histidine kinase